MNKPTSNKKILLVDDDESLRSMYSLILGKEGWELVTADDGLEGLAKIRDGGWDLILLDLMMPGLDGIGVLKALQEEPAKQANGSIIILSNAGYGSIAKEAEGLGASGFLMKADLLPPDLVEEVKKWLTK